jgi:hypothetical protein
MHMSETQPQQDVLTVASTTSGAGLSAVSTAAPTAAPPAASGIMGGVSGVGASVWVNGKVNALWSINENRNVWMGIAGVGWVKLANNSDSAIVAFTMLAANAKQTQGTVNYRQESDNMVHEMYVW